MKLLDFSLSSIGWRRGLGRGGAFLLVSPLLGPLPARSSRGEDGEHDAALRLAPDVIKCGCAERGCRLKPAFHCGRNAGFSRQLRTHFQSRPVNATHAENRYFGPGFALSVGSKGYHVADTIARRYRDCRSAVLRVRLWHQRLQQAGRAAQWLQEWVCPD